MMTNKDYMNIYRLWKNYQKLTNKNFKHTKEIFNKLNDIQICKFKEYLLKNTNLLNINKISCYWIEEENYYKFMYGLNTIDDVIKLDLIIFKYIWDNKLNIL